ncbi:MAG: DUF4266 domain-containing protein [Pseudomonadota bacterium]
MKKQNLTLSALVVLYSSTIIGCSALPTSVPVWKRGTLAKNNMALETDVLEAGLRQGTFASKEAASGGYGGTGGGCGCN